MKLRTKLIIAFILLSVLPLAGITLFSYRSSVQAFRETVERESGHLTDEMSERMELVNQELDQRIARLGELPYDEVMAAAATDHDGPGRFLDRFIEEMGESATLIKALEFLPEQPPLPPAPPQLGDEPDAFVINLAGLWEGRRSRAPVAEAGGTHALRIGNVSVFLPCQALGKECDKGPGHLHEEDIVSIVKSFAPQAGAIVAEHIAHFEGLAQMIVENVEAEVRVAENEVERQRVRPPAELAPSESTEPDLLFARDFGCSVRRGDELVGRVKATVDAGGVLHSVLSRTRTDQGEIPFAVGAEGKIYTTDPGDAKVIRGLGVAERSVDRVPDNWVVVTREDESLGLKFGIARPVGESLEQMRRATGRNLAYGLALISVAMLGIVPLSSRMTRNLSALTEGVDRLAGGDLDTRVRVRSKDEIGQLGAAFNTMAAQLSDNQKKILERDRLRRELEMCRRIQEELLPAQSGRLPFADVRALSIPARELGGDFFNYFALPDGSAALLMGDVSGKGVPAALLMANLQATLRARLPLESDLAKFAGCLDEELEASTQAASYLTLFVCIIEGDGRRLRYVNAGHNTQYLHRRGGGIEPLGSTGRPLGLIAGGGYEERSLDLGDGDSLCLFTDGLIEAENGTGEWFGEERLAALLEEASTATPDEIVTRIEQAVREHRGGAEAADDATMLVLKVDAAGMA